MGLHGIIAWIVIGTLAGWLAGKLMRGGGFGFVGDVVVGIIGAFIGGWLAGVLHISIGTGLIASVITATVGAVILVFIVRMVKRD
ncbi:MAG TPA: GlsB/YeaQ/YmgE family stress response membrane protein [Rhizomicrobium sp.]|nr:GlsB/YeaQ/YmgE family stress response membrane protein [Rhizomicrobium sp.]